LAVRWRSHRELSPTGIAHTSAVRSDLEFGLRQQLDSWAWTVMLLLIFVLVRVVCICYLMVHGERPDTTAYATVGGTEAELGRIDAELQRRAGEGGAAKGGGGFAAYSRGKKGMHEPIAQSSDDEGGPRMSSDQILRHHRSAGSGSDSDARP